ncbi:MAG: hypothetical protein IKN41_09230 [Candidatus Methanomethylophilaceae archaeon]|nr:hypothetical protein [Candidatus Methanomethylophilaceae archaeon]
MNTFNEIIEIEQKVTYIETDSTQRVYTAKGDADYIEVFMPDSEKIDVEYATDSIMGLNYRKVVVGVVSKEGVLYAPEDAIMLMNDYRYSLSILNEDIHVILDWNTVNGLSMMGGDVVLYVHHATPEDVTNAQKRTVGDRLAISVTMLVKGEAVSQLGGHADIYVETECTMVYYVDPEGRLTLLESDHSDGITHTTVNHFSIYMYTDTKVSEDLPIMWIIVGVAAALLILLLIIVVRRKKQKD